MSVAAPPRGPAAGAGLVDARPMRNPDLTSPAVMTRRAWWLVVLNVLLPGSAQVLAGSRRLGRFGLGATLVLWLLVVVGIGIALTSRSLLFTLGANWFFLLILQILLVGYALLWIVLTLDTLRLTRLVRVRPLARIAVAIVSVLLLVLTAGGALYASTLVSKTRSRSRPFSVMDPSFRPRMATTTFSCSVPIRAQTGTRCGTTASRSSRSMPTRDR